MEHYRCQQASAIIIAKLADIFVKHKTRCIKIEFFLLVFCLIWSLSFWFCRPWWCWCQFPLVCIVRRVCWCFQRSLSATRSTRRLHIQDRIECIIFEFCSQNRTDKRGW